MVKTRPSDAEPSDSPSWHSSRYALFRTVVVIAALLSWHTLVAQAIYERVPGMKSRVSSFENPNGLKGSGGRTNRTAKGNAFEWFTPGTVKTLLDAQGPGLIQRIWLTIDATPYKLRSIRLQCFWDGDSRPAVDVPLGDFFGRILGSPIPFESAMLASGEGKSFICHIPMPYRKGARVQLVNEGTETAKLFYDLDFLQGPQPATALYFQACWGQSHAARAEGAASPAFRVGADLPILPLVKGRGRFLGMTVGLTADSIYGGSWWGEGEVKMFLDGDRDYPTIAGTGAEDYAGTAWGMGTFVNQYSGCTLASDSLRQYTFYRWHVPDAIFFDQSLRISLQQIGGWGKKELLELVDRGVPLESVTLDAASGFVRLLDQPDTAFLRRPGSPDGWVNFYRRDEYAWVAFFYLDRTSAGLPALPPVADRTAGLRKAL